MGALCNTMGEQRSSSLYVGAVKTNVSHLEGAAGIAGLLKVPRQVLRRGGGVLLDQGSEFVLNL